MIKRRLEIIVSRRQTTFVLRESTEGASVGHSARKEETTPLFPEQAAEAVIALKPCQIAPENVSEPPGRNLGYFGSGLRRLLRSFKRGSWGVTIIM